MSKRFRLLLVLVLLGVAFYFLYPTISWYFIVPESKRTLASGSRTQIRAHAERKAAEALRELQGLGAEEPLPAEYAFLIGEVKDVYKAEKRPVPKTWTIEDVFRGFPGRAEILLAMENHYREDILDIKDLRDRTIQLGLDLRGGMRVLIRADLEELERTSGQSLSAAEKEDAVRRALEILNNRIDQFGVTEPQIRRQGEDLILVELPGEADRERMSRFIQGRGILNFHIVNDEALAAFGEWQASNPGQVLGPEGQILQPPILPKGTMLRGVYIRDEYGLDQLRGFTVVSEEVGLSGNYIREARVSSDPITGRPVVNFFLTGEGGDLFYKLTSENVGKSMAVVLGDKVKAQARIAEPIRDAVRVTGFDAEEANDLALVLRTGALPVPLEVINQQAVGASLGEDAIRLGLRAIIIGFALVVLFMLVYYKAAGLIADLALILNLYFIVSILSVFGFTLTLPSLAGVILTVGMAVDANVIVFERIKEEYRVGKSPKAAVKAGFAKALWAIADSNITTFIAALALSQLGKGPIQGFAVTLAVGIVSSMFTALFVSRMIFDFSTDVLKVKRLSITWRKVRVGA
ncbi:MAG: protein translocase subunit SecD [Spirochaetales bacterium]|nr:protein translocase subunit SecD [Spirochaetales bacterium]